MAPKKLFLLVTAIFLTLGLATANSFVESPQNEVWLNEGSEVGFVANYNDVCESDKQAVILDSNNNEVESYGVSEEYEKYDGEGDLIGYEYGYEFEDTGSFKVQITCTPEDNSDGEPKDVEEPEENIEVGELELNLDSVKQDTIYEGETFEGNIVLESNNEEMSILDLDFEHRFNEREKESLDVIDNSFEDIEASDSDIELFEVFASSESLDFEVSDSVSLDVQDVWQIENLNLEADSRISDDTVKYRHLDQLRLDFTVNRKDEGFPGLRTDEFLFDGENDWFEKNDRSDGDYTLNIDGRPVYSDLSVSDPVNVEIHLDNVREDIENKVELVDLRIEEDVQFSGRVLNVRNNRVDTEFTIQHDNRVRSFSTDDSGLFEQFIETDTVDMVMRFPEARVNLDNMQVDREDAGDISYNYYDDVEEQIDTDNLPSVRPINLASFISNYHFDEGIDSNIRMEFDTSEIDPDKIEVYECVEWTFRSESCDGDWSIISENDVGLTPGATWKADFPITPRESERFGHEDGVLTNAYLVGVPEGVGSDLVLEDSLDVENSRIVSGGEFKASGKIIDGTTGDSVEDANINLELVGEENIVFEASTGSNGVFEVSGQLNEPDSYEVVFSAVKNPYESFEQEQSNAVEVYYETGLSVSSESNPEVVLGEDYTIEYTIENIGQTEAEDIDLSVSGVDESSYELAPTSVSSLSSGSSETVVLTLNLDEDLRTPPTISFEASGISDGDEVTGSATTSASFSDEVDLGSSRDEQEANQETTSTGSESSYSIPDTNEISQATGDFINSQSDMNMALGLILVFGAILAVAVRKQNGGNERADRMNGRMAAGGTGRGRVQKPQVAPEKVDPEEVEDKAENTDTAEAEKEEQDEKDDSPEKNGEDSDEGEFTCDTCGQGFDTESGLNLHEQALHN